MAYQLICQKKHCLQTELAVAEIEQVFEGWTEEIDHHRIVIAFSSEPTNERNTNATGESLIHLGFVLQLRVFGLDRLEFDGNLLARDDVDAEVDVTCGEQSV